MSRRSLTIGVSALMLIGGIALVIVALGLFNSDETGTIPPPQVFTAPTPTATVPPATVVPTPAPSEAPIDRLVIEKIGVDAGIQTVHLDRSGVMETPNFGSVVGWYDLCGSTAPVIWSGCADQPQGSNYSRPGFGGNATFSGHVTHLSRPSIFYELSKLAQGDLVQIQLSDGTQYDYKVIELQVYPPEGPHVEKIIGPAGREVVTLITCYDFNAGTQDYNSRIIVVAERVTETSALAP